MNAIQFFEWGSKGKYFLKRIYDNLVTDNVIVQYRYGEKWCPAKVLSKKYIEENNPALKYKECIILEADFTKTPIFAEFFYITIIDDPILFSLTLQMILLQLLQVLPLISLVHLLSLLLDLLLVVQVVLVLVLQVV